MGYLYYGIERQLLRRLLRRGSILATTSTVSLLFATATGSSHVAAWMGVSTPSASAWLQAGIEKTAGGHIAEYIEVGRHHRQLSLREWPTRLGHRARIRLLRRGDLWRIRIDQHVSHWTWIPVGHVNTLALLEIYHQRDSTASGVAVINKKKVSG